MLRRWWITSRVNWLDCYFLNRKTFFEALFKMGQVQREQANIMIELTKRLNTLESALAEEKRKNEAIAKIVGDALNGVRRQG